MDLEQQRPKGFSLSATPTLHEGLDEKPKAASSIIAPEPLSPTRKALILAILSGAQFFDAVNACAAIVSLPQMAMDLQFQEGTVQWVLSGYTLTFAAFMLVSGRLGDIFHPKPIFSSGFLVIGLLSIPIGASVNPIMAIVFRALQGIGAAMNVPAAVAMISIYFTEKDRAYAIYGAAGAVGNVVGLILGGVLTSTVSWRWDRENSSDFVPFLVFYLLAIVTIPLSILSWFILPPYQVTPTSERRSIDWPGVVCLTIGLIFFVFAISEGSSVGWSSARVIATLALSVILLVAFFFIECIVSDPAFPPSTWSNKNFTPLFFYACSIYWYYFACETQLVQLFIDVWQISSLSASLRCLPIGIAGGIAAYLTGVFAPNIPRRLLLLMGQVFMGVGAILFALGDTPQKYWPYLVPGMIIGMVGTAVAYVGCTIFVMDGARPGEEGVVGAMMYTAYQLGATVGLASQFFRLLFLLRILNSHRCLVVTSITIGVNKNQPTDTIWLGYQASFWSVLGMNGLVLITACLFIND
ncbi:major facilitator superfamily domain-containing protein [Infundibulicybe gibba]|nr:major facilitator superfamily domain-containing protein [Infundibulicybe gibba]